MEQLYLIEIFVKNVTIFLESNDIDTNKDLFIRCMFGPRKQFIFKEGMIAPPNRGNEIVKPKVKKEGTEEEEIDEYGDITRWIRVFRVGKSLLFPEFPDNLLLLMEKYPLDFSVWSGEIDENPELIGVGNMHWHTQYFGHVKANMDPCFDLKPLSSKEIIPIMKECCCTKIGEIHFILRLTPMGYKIICEYQQLIDSDPDNYVFRSDKCPSLFRCKQIQPEDDKEMRHTGSIYEIACREDPEVIRRINKKIEVCTELESCGVKQPGTSFSCLHPPGLPKNVTGISPKLYPIDKIRMGDIVGPCGNANCLIAHKMRIFIRNQYVYKKEILGRSFPTSDRKNKRVCGQCGCKHDMWHSEKAEPLKNKPICQGCGGVAQSGETCDDRLKKLHGTGITPLSSKTNVVKSETASTKADEKKKP